MHDTDALRNYLRASNRYPLTASGRSNSYSLFAESFLNLTHRNGRVGAVLPTGIATDDSNKSLFAALIEDQRLVQLASFYEIRLIFPGTDSRQPFCLATIGGSQGASTARFCFALRSIADAQDERRTFSLGRADIALFNPNTRTCPIFRTHADADLTRRIYQKIPVFINESVGQNPWAASFRQGLFNMSSDSALFRTLDQLQAGNFRLTGNYLTNSRERYLPLYEGKMIWQFDHRYGTYRDLAVRPQNSPLPTPSEHDHQDPGFVPLPWYWVSETHVDSVLEPKCEGVLFGFRDVTNAASERTVIVSAVPRVAINHKLPLISASASPALLACLMANFNSLVLDYCCRQKIGANSLSFFIFKQLPVLPPEVYTHSDVEFVVPRVAELIGTAWDVQPFLDDLWRQADASMRSLIEKQWLQNRASSHAVETEPPAWCVRQSAAFPFAPFAWHADRRAVLLAELDAFYAKLYGLSESDLRYILHPGDIYGADFPGETFRVLRENETARYGEYRTKRCVMEAWERLSRADVKPVPSVSQPRTEAELSDGARAAGGDGPDAALAQLAAIVKALPGPTPMARVRLAALYALEPRCLTRRLSGADRSTWLRLVGQAAQLPQAANVVSFSPRVHARWGAAVSQLRGMGALLEDLQAQTWAPGPKISEFNTELWPDGRASFVFRVLGSLSLQEASAGLSPEDAAWVLGYAA